MTTYDLVLLPEAEAEVRQAFLWYFERSPLPADAFRTEVFDALDGLTTSARMWAENEDGFRGHVLRRYPYTVWYEIVAQTVNVLALAHQRRRPGCWQVR